MRKIYIFIYLIFLEFKRIFFKKKYQAAFDVTNNCNLRCKHCYHFKNLHKNHKCNEIPLDVWEKRFENLHKKGIRFVLLSGGEPALRMDVIELAYNIFTSVRVATNGQIGISKKLKNLVIFLSIDGCEDKNDFIRGSGTFQKAIKNYSGDGRVILSMTLMKDNHMELEKNIKIARKHFFRGVACGFYSSAENDSLIINKKEKSIIVRELRRMRKIYPQYFLSTKSMIDWYEKADHRGYCYWGDDVLHFNSSWQERRCFPGADCSNCGCFVGSIRNPFSLYLSPREAFKFI